MRVLMVHPRMDMMGGGERVAIHSIIAALTEGHEVVLISEEFDVKKFEDFFGCDGLFSKIQRYTYPTFEPFAPGFILYQRLRYYQKELRGLLLKDRNFQLVLSTQDVGFVGSERLAPLVQYCYYPEYFLHLESHPSSPLWTIYYWPATRFYRDRIRIVDQFLSVSEFTRNLIKARWGRESKTLYPPCPVGSYTATNTSREDLVVTVGRFSPEKRMHVFADIARSLPNFKFVIIGSISGQGEKYYEWLRRNSPGNVSFVLSPLRKVRDILARAKVYVHCAKNEHFGITIVEAMAAGCVPIVHDSGGPREIVTDDVGYRWRASPEAVGQISGLFEDEELRQRLSKSASTRAHMFRPEAFESGFRRVLKDYAQ